MKAKTLLLSFALVASLQAGENLGQQSPKPSKGGAAELKPIPFEDQTPDGLLKDRAVVSFRRLQ